MRHTSQDSCRIALVAVAHPDLCAYLRRHLDVLVCCARRVCLGTCLARRKNIPSAARCLDPDLGSDDAGSDPKRDVFAEHLADMAAAFGLQEWVY